MRDSFAMHIQEIIRSFAVSLDLETEHLGV